MKMSIDHNFLTKRKDKIVVLTLLVVVLSLSTVQLFRDLGQISWGEIVAELPGLREANDLAAQKPPDPQTKLSHIVDNYHRCQNKLGQVKYYLPADNGVSVAALKTDLYQFYLTGARYVSVKVNSYDEAVRQQLENIINVAYQNHLIPLIYLQSTYGASVEEQVTNISALYRGLDNVTGEAEFVATTAPRIMLDQNEASETVEVATLVAEALKDNEDVITASPEIWVDYTQLPINKMSELRDGGLKLENFDIMLLSLHNRDVQFGEGMSNYQSRGYFLFYELFPNKPNLETQYFSAKQWLRDENDQLFRQHMQAIVVDYGPPRVQPNQDELSSKPLEQYAYDFGSFSDDPDIAAVIFQGNTESVLEWSNADLAKINLAGTNCNYDSEVSNFKYEKRSNANACEVRRDAQTPEPTEPKAAAKVVCSGDGPDGSCYAAIHFTIQVGLPIRHFGSNSAIGTDTNPYMPVSGLVAQTSHINVLDPLQQFAGKLAGSDGSVYPVPWLGSAIYNSSEILRTSFNSSSDPRQLRTLLYNDGAAGGERLAELNSEYAKDRSAEYDYADNTTWCYTFDPSTGRKQVALDEYSLFNGKNFCLDKSEIEQIDALKSYSVTEYAARKTEVNACGGDVEVVKRDPQNMVYGTEAVVRTDEWFSTKSELCYNAWRGEGDLSDQGINCTLASQGSTNAPGRQPLTDGEVCECQEKGVPLTVANLKPDRRTCSLSKAQINSCITYNSGAEDYARSRVYFKSDDFPGSEAAALPKYAVEGAYSSLANMYQLVQDSLSQRGLKIVFNQKLGWESEVIVKAYRENSADGTAIPYPRENRMTDRPDRNYPSLSAAQAAANGTSPNPGDGGSTPTAGSCQVGINFATKVLETSSDAIAEAADIGYGYGIVSVMGTEDPGQVKGKVQEMCDKGLTPVLRSCNKEECGFSGGAQQASFLNAVTDVSCAEVYVACGHNEPISENPLGMVNEGQWAKACANGLDLRDGKVKMTTPTFNATHPTLASNISQFLSGYESFATDKSKYACLSFNTYSNVGGSNTAASFYDAITAIPDFAGMPTCIMEAGDASTGDIDATYAAVDGLIAKSPLMVLGFNWMNTNPAWLQFSLSDKGAYIVDNVCGGGNGGSAVGGPRLSIPVETRELYNLYLADERNYDKFNQYYEMLGYIDELARLYDVYQEVGQLYTGTVRLGDNGQLYFGEYVAETIMGLYGCNSPAYNKAIEELKKAGVADPKLNCVDLISARDPLGDFLCEKGYAVDGYCSLQCIGKKVTVEEIGTVNNPSCPMQGDKCYQDPLGSYTHYCSSNGDPAFDLYTGANETIYAPEDGTVAYVEKNEDYNCTAKTGVQLTQESLIKLNENRKVGDAKAIVEKIKTRGSYDDLQSSGGVIGFKGDSGVYYRLRHVNITADQLTELMGKRFVGGEAFSAGGVEIQLYHVPDEIYTPCWLGAHLHTWAKTGVTDESGIGSGEYVNPYELYGQVLGCGSTNGNACRVGPGGCTPPNWVSITGEQTGGGGVDLVGQVCTTGPDGEIDNGNGPANGCNEWNCGIGTNDNFAASLQCMTNIGYFKSTYGGFATYYPSLIDAGDTSAGTDAWVDRYGPYCHNETFNPTLPFAHNLMQFYDTYLPPGSGAGRVCGELPPALPKDGDKGVSCDEFGGALARVRGNENFDYYRGALTRCPIPVAQMFWTPQNGGGITRDPGLVAGGPNDEIRSLVRPFAEQLHGQISYSGMQLSNTPIEKVVEVVAQSYVANINPYVVLGIWGTESWFGQYKPECNVF